ncbi:MAG: hypothetical protein K2G49_02255 [Muribaculum sp.]|nr:hypothetical protein [Muribaculum sp.]
MSDYNMQYDESEAIKFIRQYMPEGISERYSDDEILNILDMIWDYYEDNGLLEIPSSDEQDDASPELGKILDYVNKMLAKDKLAAVDKDDVRFIVEGELAYEKSIGLED